MLIDLVFCLDTSESMSPFINELKQNAGKLYELIIEELDEFNYHIDSFRVRFVTFKDYKNDKDYLTETKFFSLPLETEEFLSFVNSIEPSGGKSGYTNALDAFYLALTSDWKVPADIHEHVRQCVLIVTDKESYPTINIDNKEAPHNLDELLEIYENGLKNNPTYRPKYNRVTTFVKNTWPWNKMCEDRVNRFWPAFIDEFSYESKDDSKQYTTIDIKLVLDLLCGSF